MPPSKFPLRNLFVQLILLLSISSLISPSCSKPPPLIVLMTDFGEKDFYIGAIKGAIYKVNPNARIDYISNYISKFNVEEGAYTLLKSAVEYPAGTIFVVVVDPGVGTKRKPIAVKTRDGKFYIGPDNGIFSLVIDEFGLEAIYEISNPDVMQKEKMSSTFHGRDIFGPAGGHLSRGIPIEQLGKELTDYVRFDSEKARIVENKVVGKIVVVDDYGNVISNIQKNQFEELGWSLGVTLEVKVGSQEFNVEFVKAYGDVPTGAYLGLFGSGEVFEVAINQGDLAKALNLKSGDRIEVSK